MKKITLLLITLLASQFGNAQQTISFEVSEGYSLGDINGQNGWVVTGDGAGGFVSNQVVTADLATAGTQSLKVDVDPAFGGQSNPIIGGFYNYMTPIPYNPSVFSFDVNISEQNTNSSDYIFGLVNLTAGVYVTYIRFSFNGNILVLARDGSNTVIQPDTNADWAPGVTYNVRIEIAGNTETFFIDNAQIYTGTLVSAADIEQARFIHDNFGGFAIMDNFRTNNEATASVNEFNSNIFTHFYDKDSDVITLKSSTLAFDNIQIYNLMGQEVLNKNLSQTTETLNLSELNDGLYLANLMMGGQVQTLKFLKH